MVNYQRLSKPMALSALLYLGMLINPLSAFNIAVKTPNSLSIGGQFVLAYSNFETTWIYMDVKLAVLNSNNVLDVIASVATNSNEANNMGGIYTVPNNIPEGSNYFFIAQETGGSSYAETGPYNIPKTYSPFGSSSLPSVSATTVLETYPLDIPAQAAVAQTSSSSSSTTTGSVAATPTTPSYSTSANTKSSSATAALITNEKASNGGSNITNEGSTVPKIFSLTRGALIAIVVTVPSVVLCIIITAVCCFIRRRRRRRRRMDIANDTTPWGTRTTQFVTTNEISSITSRY